MMKSSAGICAETAHAKINLALHVTGKRADGYHDLDSLVVFAASSDRITAIKAETVSLTLQGPGATKLPSDSGNSVLMAAQALSDNARINGLELACAGAELVLEKNLPVAAGIGGGSADAAATLRALNRLWGLNLAQDVLERIGARLGADVAVCIGGQTCRMRGIGEQLTPLAEQHMPRLDLVLVNPGVPVATPSVFQSLENPHQSILPPLPDQYDFESWLNWLDGTRNDLFQPACKICPQIGDVISELNRTGAKLSRMSGSGASCFGIFETPDDAESAATALKKRHHDWWICATHTV